MSEEAAGGGAGGEGSRESVEKGGDKEIRKAITDLDRECKITHRIRGNKPNLFLLSFYFWVIFIFNNVFYNVYVLCMNIAMHYT